MYDLSSPDFWVVALMGFAVGIFLGWVITSLAARRGAGGKTVADMEREMEQYREQVDDHFARTAELFKDTTEKYRDLYEHLAGGAQTLCNDLPDRARVEFRPGRLLADDPDKDVKPGEPLAEPPRTGP